MINLNKFSIFKKKEKIVPIHFHMMSLKLKSHNSELYSGKFIKLDCDYDENGDLIENVKYYFKTIEGEKITSYIPENEELYCEKYEIGIIKDIQNDNINILLICEDVYINKYKILIDKETNNGEAFIIKNGDLIDNNKVIGKIIDDRYNQKTQILINSYENGLLNVLIHK